MRKFYWSIFLVTVATLSVSAQTFYLVRDLRPGTGSANPSNLVTVNESIFFQAGDSAHGSELWKTDGTEAGTVMIKDICPGSASGIPVELINFNGTVYFRANDGIHGEELWKTDGTAQGTMMVKDIYPGNDAGMPSHFIRINNNIFFSANDGSHGTELWKSDGTEAGTVMVKDLYQGINDSKPSYFINMNGILFFSATDGIHAGYDLWKSDGTDAGTILLKDIYPGSATATVADLTHVNGKLFFTAGGDPASTLWKSDGTEAGTEIVRSFVFPSWLTDVNGTLFFQGRSNTQGIELWKSDGTETGTIMVKDIRIGAGSGAPESLLNIEGVAYFKADDGSGYKLWRSDGTETGTRPVKNVNPENMTNIKGRLYFSAWEGSGLQSNKEIWRSDGTEAGTIMVQNISSTGGSSPADFTLAGLKLYVAATENIYGRELWMADLNSPTGGLPLTMVGFNGQLVGNSVFLKWKTVAEHNTSHFEIERSPDGSFFSKIGDVTAAGNSNIERQYGYVDPNVMLQGTAVLYYRLKMKDNDGKFTYSRIIGVAINSKQVVLMFYPNPARENAVLMVAAPNKENISCSIIDASQRVVLRNRFVINEGSNSILVETNSLSPGVYTLMLNGANTNKSLRFVKQ